MIAVIFANGEMLLPSNWDELSESADFFIAADGGAEHMFDLGVTPDFVVGDLDSLSEDRQSELHAKGVKVSKFPEEKDETDLELALLHASELGASKIFIIAALGRRWDHSLANILLATNPNFQNLQIEILHAEERIFLIRDEIEISAEEGTRISLIPLGGGVSGVHTKGLLYPLEGEQLLFGSSRGISNVLLSKKASVRVESGMLLAVLIPQEMI